MRALFDTNILIDFLNGVTAARTELGRYQRPAISIITWIEVLAGATPATESPTRRFLASFERLGVTEAVGEKAIALRRSMKLRLPDAIIFATAQSEHLVLVTRNTRDFPADHPGIRVPYRA